jgi:hypothetical protein
MKNKAEQYGNLAVVFGLVLFLIGVITKIKLLFVLSELTLFFSIFTLIFCVIIGAFTKQK